MSPTTKNDLPEGHESIGTAVGARLGLVAGFHGFLLGNL